MKNYLVILLRAGRKAPSDGRVYTAEALADALARSNEVPVVRAPRPGEKWLNARTVGTARLRLTEDGDLAAKIELAEDDGRDDGPDAVKLSIAARLEAGLSFERVALAYPERGRP